MDNDADLYNFTDLAFSQETIISNQTAQVENFHAQVKLLKEDNEDLQSQLNQQHIITEKQHTRIEELTAKIKHLTEKNRELQAQCANQTHNSVENIKVDFKENVVESIDYNDNVTQNISQIELNLSMDKQNIYKNEESVLSEYIELDVPVTDRKIYNDESEYDLIEYLVEDEENIAPVPPKKSKRSSGLGDIMICQRCKYTTNNVSGFNAHVKNNCPGRSADEKSPTDHSCFICKKSYDERGLRLHLNRFTDANNLKNARSNHKNFSVEQHKRLHTVLGQKVSAKRKFNIPYDPITWHIDEVLAFNLMEDVVAFKPGTEVAAYEYISTQNDK